MGIQGLLPFLKKSSHPVNLNAFKGKTAAIDAYCWLHKGAFSCADKLVKGEPTDGYVVYVMKQVSLLLSFNIKPILVFDGCRLPAKEGTEIKRREMREKNRRKAKELLREGKVKEARECFQRCVDVTSSMAHEVIKACRARNVDIIVAPYEADAQLAFFSHSGVADIIITEDSDLVLFGCDKIIFKLDNNGGGILVEKEKLHFSMNVPRDKFDFVKFRNMCILSGCDYLPSLHGIGLAKACRFFVATSNPDVFNSLCRLSSFLKMHHLDVNLEYRKGFMKAIDTILHQLVFDPFTHTLKPLTPYPAGVSHEDMPYCGAFFGHERALQIALGNIDVQTGEIIDDYDPQKSKRPEIRSIGWHNKGTLISNHPSIWNPNYKLIKATLEVEQNGKLTESGIAMRGKECSVESPFFKRKRTAVEIKPENISISEDYLESLYSNKKRKNTNECNSNIEEETVTSEMTNSHDEDAINETKESNSLTICSSSDAEEINDLSKEVKEVKHTQSGSSSTVLEREKEIKGSCDKSSSNMSSRNPFAKRKHVDSESGTKNVSKFSALTKFSSSLQQRRSTVVLSRYFKTSPTNGSTTNVNSQKENITESKGAEESAEQSYPNKILPVKNEEKKPSLTMGSPLKLKNQLVSSPPRLIPSIRQQQLSSFQWRGKLSSEGQNGDERRIGISMEDDSGLLTPPLSQETENRDNTQGRYVKKEKPYDCTGGFSINTTNLSLPNDVNEGVSVRDLLSRDDVEEKTATGRAFSSPLQRTPSSLRTSSATKKCRVSGLRKSSTQLPALKQRQLNLKEMFTFKKDVVKIHSS